MKSIWLLVLLLPFGHAVIVMNSTDLPDLLELNDTLFLEDLNKSITFASGTANISIGENISVLGNFTISGPPEFLEETFQLSPGETRNFYGNNTVSCPGEQIIPHEDLSLDHGETRDIVGNFTVSCEDPPRVTEFNESRELDPGEIVTRSFASEFCDIHYSYEAPDLPENTTGCEEEDQGIFVDVTKAPGECQTIDEKGNSIKICCSEPPPQEPEYKIVEYNNTLYDLGQVDRDNCTSPIYVEGKKQWLCLDTVSQYCPADVMTTQGCEGCTRYALNLATEELNNSLIVCKQDVQSLGIEIEGKADKIENLTLEAAECQGKKDATELALYELIAKILLVIVAVGFGIIYFRDIHNDKRLPSVREHEKDKTVPFKSKF